MVKRGLFCVIALALAIIFAASTISPLANNTNNAVGEAKSLSDGIVALKSEGTGAQNWINNGLAETAGVTAEFYIMALSQSGNYNFSSYRNALNAYVKSKNTAAATTRQKYALALIATGQKDGYVTEVAENSIGKQGVMSYAFGLHLINNGIKCSESAESVKAKLISLQNQDGGWALTGTKSDVDVTAMTVQALAPYYNTDESVKTAIDSAIALLSSRQLADGDFLSYGKANAESTAQVWLALSELGIDGLTDNRFIKNGKTLLDGIKKYRLADGGFCHESGGSYNENATAQVYFSLTAYLRMLNRNGAIYIFDAKGDQQGDVSLDNESLVSNVDGESTDNSLNGTQPDTSTQEAEKWGYKPWAVIIITATAIIACIICFVTKKRNKGNFIFIAVIAAALIAFVLATNFRTADEYYSDNGVSKQNAVGTVTLEIRCDTVAGSGDDSYIPKNGTILKATKFEIEENDTVYDVLTDAAKKHRIQLETTGGDGLIYVAGINYLYELQFGDLSGWVYRVNGESVSVGCDEYKLKDGDTIVWHYTCNLGEDIK